jgi:hypothetical protein
MKSRPPEDLLGGLRGPFAIFAVKSFTAKNAKSVLKAIIHHA